MSLQFSRKRETETERETEKTQTFTYYALMGEDREENQFVNFFYLLELERMEFLGES